ncbi:MAG: hypothetical protein IJ300_07995 [Clostridia bacterium]|nr:hypothetical protein [Clostridia bacterium]MBQ8767046.1 hypothetical protein [Clostridia bacterium]
MGVKEFLEKVYSEINDNIKFSEAKNAALITLNSALIAGSAEKVFDSSILFKWRALIAILVLLLLIPTIVSLFSFRAKTDSENCIVNKIYCFLGKSNHIKNTPEKIMYYAYITKYYKDKPKEYLEKVDKNSISNVYFLQLSRQIVDLATVAYNKFLLFNLAIKLECILFSAGGIFALVTVIAKIISYW